jgi:hypothetical protein
LLFYNPFCCTFVALSPPYKIVGCRMGLIMIIGLVQLMSLFIPC